MFSRQFVLLHFLALLLVVAVICRVEDPNRPDPDAITDGLSVQILPPPDRNPAVNLDGVFVEFHNRGKKPVYIFKQLDGSVNCWQMPNYHFTLRDAAGRLVEYRGRCGLSGIWADTKWPDDYIVEIKPGARYREPIWLTGYFQVPRSGPYTVSFEYVYQSKDGPYPPPANAWLGTAKAADVVIGLKETPVPKMALE
jgi:hypothetical protein